jgi:hypothetical protein
MQALAAGTECIAVSGRGLAHQFRTTHHHGRGRGTGSEQLAAASRGSGPVALGIRDTTAWGQQDCQGAEGGGEPPPLAI